ncbi:hypothetical protein R3P38DRAFT_2705473 [Favolaschia claudopus]|uniref:Uncharacterized protein n=1 Tax=Favolaschia claudopus TaxID=2862362 RepID=A0AAW0BK73_9AGAR
MPAYDESEVEDNVDNSTPGSKKKRAGPRASKADAWRYLESGAPVTQRAGKLLTALAGIYTRSKRQVLDAILTPPQEPPSCTETSYNAGDIHSVMHRLRAQEYRSSMFSLDCMLTLTQLALNIDSLQADRARKGRAVLSMDALSDMYSGITPRRTFATWVNNGMRLLLLCAAGSMYVLPIIAALGMQAQITDPRSSTELDIVSLAGAIRVVKKGQWLPLVRRLMVPLKYMMSTPSAIQQLALSYNVPKGMGEAAETRIYTFSNVAALDAVFDSVQTNVWKLPQRAEEWNTPSKIDWPRLGDPRTVKLPALYKIKSPLKLAKSRSPLNKSNRSQFTQTQRELAKGCPIVKDLRSLEDMIKNDLHCSGKLKPKSYIEINRDTIQEKSLMITDCDGKLMALYFSVPEEFRQPLADALGTIQALMPGEFKHENSLRPGFKYFSCHYSWYARFAEQGDGAPADIHADNLRKDHTGRVNFDQRLPHQSKEIFQNPEDHALLAEAFADFFELIRVAFKHYLPEQYSELHIYADSLPLCAASPAYPFGGFVINVSGCSWGHRDEGDNILCFVIGAIPPGKCEGGQLCLYELGLSFDIQLGDVIAFPSCDITHFNQHFTGYRATIVLHSDRQSKVWEQKRNGWDCHIVRHDNE